MFSIALSIFVITYIGIALGEIPFLQLDRTGIALLGAILMIVFGVLSIDQINSAVDLPTLFLLYSLMIISAQLRLGGFYTWLIFKMTPYVKKPFLFLGLSMLVSAILSAILANDIICLAFTPIMTVSVLQARMNPVPFLLGLALSSNIGSASTIIGNPQNMLIGQIGKLNFLHFILWCLPPALISLFFSYGVLCFVYRNRFTATTSLKDPITKESWPTFDRDQTFKGLLAVGLLIILFFTSYPRELTAIGIAGVLICSRKFKSRHILGLIDWPLITLFFALFVLIQGIENVHLPQKIAIFLRTHEISIQQPFILVTISAFLSNLVSNVPAVMLLLQFLNPENPTEYYILATASTFAGNFILIGSIANLIVVEQASLYGVSISFKEHAKVGVPITLGTLLFLFLYIGLLGFIQG
ncbi:MAG: SLC13 family permease [Planctomycetota bacterium]